MRSGFFFCFVRHWPPRVSPPLRWADFYGLEMIPRRIMSVALRPRAPGLYLTGEDVLTPGIAGSLFGGMLTAAAIDPRVCTKID